MAEADLQRFLHKVQQLDALVASLETNPQRREALVACSDHNQVVRLARTWGYEIGKRWGESVLSDDPGPGAQSSGSLASPEGIDPLLRSALPPDGTERVRQLQSGPGWHLDLIHSCAASSADGYWYDQDEHEWLTLLRGSARLALQSPEQTLDLSVGDGLYLAPHRRHRVERTDPEPGTLWLALYWEASDEDGRPTPARITSQ
jgi:cupin 2 domain-containing protein